jgi:hypothetical protein
LRQGHFFPKRAHVLCHPLAILDVHARQVWKKKAPENIDVTTIAFDTRQPLHTLAEWGLPIPAEHSKLRSGVFHTKPDSELQVFLKCHRNKSGRNGETYGRIFCGQNKLADHCGRKKGDNFQKVNL